MVQSLKKMARQEGYESRSSDETNPYVVKHGDRVEKPFYKKPWVIAIGIVAAIIIFMMMTDNLNIPFLNQGGDNQTQVQDIEEVSKEQQLVNYIIAQQEAGKSKEKIIELLTLSGYNEKEIKRAFELTDPIVQDIIKMQQEGKPRTEIVNVLLQAGYTPKVIQEKFKIAEPQKTGFWEGVKNNWWIIVIVVIIIWYLRKHEEDAKEKKGPKVYTLEECREYAEETLKQKNLEFVSTNRYRTRADIKQHRYIYVEPLYPEFNSHKPWGHKAGRRNYYLIGVGFDKELVDFELTADDNKINQFIAAAPKSYESSGAADYQRMREQSERPIEERQEMDRPYPYAPMAQSYGQRPVSRRRRPTTTRRRYSPGPIEGFEEQ